MQTLQKFLSGALSTPT